MTRTSANALAVSRPVIQILTVLNIVYSLCLAALLVLSFLMPGWPERALGFDIVNKYPDVPVGLRAIVLVGILGAVIAHTILRRLLAIIDTVRVGDPFTLDNVRRLHAIAWGLVALESARVVVAAIARLVWEPGRIEAFSIPSWLAVVLLFVLAGVFDHGVRMRTDLEGTV